MTNRRFFFSTQEEMDRESLRNHPVVCCWCHLSDSISSTICGLCGLLRNRFNSPWFHRGFFSPRSKPWSIYVICLGHLFGTLSTRKICQCSTVQPPKKQWIPLNVVVPRLWNGTPFHHFFPYDQMALGGWMDTDPFLTPKCSDCWRYVQSQSTKQLSFCWLIP